MPSCPVVNPGNAELGLPDDNVPDMDLETAMEELMDTMEGMPRVGKAPEDEKSNTF